MHLFKPRKPNIDAVFLQYGDMLYRLALSRLGNDADAQDVVLDVFVKYDKIEFKINLRSKTGGIYPTHIMADYKFIK